MKSKTLSLFIVGIFALVLLISFASAFTINSVPPSLSFTNAGESQTITVSTNDSSLVNFSYSGVNSNIFSITTLDGTTNVDSVSYNITLNEGFFGSDSETLTIKAVNSTNSSITNSTSVILSYEKISFCEHGFFIIDKEGNPKTDSNLDFFVDITNEGQGDDNEWVGLDTIKVEVNLENNFNEDYDSSPDFDNTQFELGLYDETGENVADKLIWISEDEEKSEDMDLDAEEEITYIFEFRVDPELEGGDYQLVIKAYNDEDGENPNNHESFCIDYSEDLDGFGDSDYFAEISIEQETDKDKMVIVDVDALPKPIEVFCNDVVSITVDVWNIGDEDFEDQIMVNLYNTELGIDIEKVIDGDLDSGDNEEVTFEFELPDDVEAKQYTLRFRTYYDYDKDDGKYYDDYDKISDEIFEGYLKVTGDCSSAKVSVSATLYEGGKAGQPLTVKATLTNTGAKSATYLINIAGYNGWADSYELSQSSVTINSGNSADVLITFNTKKGIQGDQLFTLDVLSDSQLIASQPVSVPIEGSSGFLGITGFAINEGNWYVWGIILLDIIFVIVIIIIAVRIARRK